MLCAHCADAVFAATVSLCGTRKFFCGHVCSSADI
jgi:hypothetical protein